MTKLDYSFRLRRPGITVPSKVMASNPVKSLLKIAGLGDLTNNCNFMLCPPERWARGQSAIAHIPWVDGGAGDMPAGSVSLSRPSVKNEIYNDVLTEYAAGQLSRAGTIEPAATKENAVISAWVNSGGLSAENTGKTDPLGGSTAVELVEDSSTGSHYKTEPPSITHPDGARFACEVCMKRGVGTRHAGIILAVLGATNRVYAYVNFDTLAVDSGAIGSGALDYASATQHGDWIKVILVGKPHATLGANQCELAVTTSTDGTYANRSYAGDGSSSIYFAMSNITISDIAMSYISGAAATVRSADTLSFSDASGFGAIAPEGTLFGVYVSPCKPSVLSAHLEVATLSYGGDFDHASGGSQYVYTNKDDNKFVVEGWKGTTQQMRGGANTLGDHAAGTTITFAVSWRTGQRRFVVNGVVEQDESKDPPLNLDRLDVFNIPGLSLDGSGSMLLLGTLDTYGTDAEMKKLTGAAMRSYLEDLAGV